MSRPMRHLRPANALPKVKSVDQLARFVETHDLGKLFEDAPLLRDDLGTGPLRQKMIRLPSDVIKVLNRVAPRMGLDATNLIRSYVLQGLRKDLASSR